MLLSYLNFNQLFIDPPTEPTVMAYGYRWYAGRAQVVVKALLCYQWYSRSYYTGGSRGRKLIGTIPVRFQH